MWTVLTMIRYRGTECMIYTGILALLCFCTGETNKCCIQNHHNGTVSFHVNGTSVCYNLYTWYKNDNVVAYYNATKINDYLSQDCRSITFKDKPENVSYKSQECNKTILENKIHCNYSCSAYTSAKDEHGTKYESPTTTPAPTAPNIQNNSYVGIIVAIVLVLFVCFCIIACRNRLKRCIASLMETRQNYIQAHREPADERV